jgi:hypothetical protein
MSGSGGGGMTSLANKGLLTARLAMQHIICAQGAFLRMPIFIYLWTNDFNNFVRETKRWVNGTSWQNKQKSLTFLAGAGTTEAENFSVSLVLSPLWKLGCGSGLDLDSMTLWIRIPGQNTEVETIFFVHVFQFYNEKVCRGSGSALDPDSMPCGSGLS